MDGERDDAKKPYEPPRVLRLGDTGGGAGACEAFGSGDVGDCHDGNFAGAGCLLGVSASNCRGGSAASVCEMGVGD